MAGNHPEQAGPVDAGRLAELDYHFGQAVQRQFDGGVPPKLMLGGGLMSAAIAFHAQRAGVSLRAWTVGLPRSPEFEVARRVAHQFGHDCIEHVVTPEQLRESWIAEIGRLPGPAADPGHFLLAALARHLHAESPRVLCGAHGQAVSQARVALAGLDARFPWADEPLSGLAAPAGGIRAALRQLMQDRLPQDLLDRAPAQLLLPPALFLQGMQGRLLGAVSELRGRPAAGKLDLQVVADELRAFYAGEPVSAYSAFGHAVSVLWWAASRPAPRRRLVVYTALVGPKETLANPLADLPPGSGSDLEIDFVCVTDNPALRSEVWRIESIPGGHLPPEKLSRRSKALPHEYFPDHEFSLYVDNTVTFKRLPQASDLASQRPYLFRAFRHATRSNPEQEAAAVAQLGYDDVGTICGQLDFYAAQRDLASITPLTTATVLLREHHRPEVRRFGITWWESILAFSKRDQLSFDFARQLSGAEVEYFDGFTHDNPMIRWNGSLSQHRVKASFDAKRYAWLHRADADARRDPKAHFLARGGSDADYVKRSPLLEFACWSQGSSLGTQVSPRRAMAGTLEALLAPHRDAGKRFLLVRVQGGSAAQAFAATELDAATRALSVVMHPARGTLIDLQSAELVADGKVFETSQEPYDLAIVLGPTGDQAAAVVQKLHRLLRREQGAIVMALASPATLLQAADGQAWLESALGASAETTLHASAHDDLREPLPNTVIGTRWEAAAVAA